MTAAPKPAPESAPARGRTRRTGSCARLRRVALVAAVAALPGCEALLTDPAPALPQVSVAFSVQGEAAGGVASAFDRVNRAHLLFVRPDSARRDTLVRIVSRDGVATARLVLDTRERVAALGIAAELRAGDAPLFAGSAIVRVASGEPTRAEIPIEPVPGRVRADREGVLLSAGDTVRLGAALLFATGDTIPGVPLSWRSDDPQIVAVTPSGVALGRRPGEVRLIVSFRDLADTVFARVRGDRLDGSR